MSSLDIASHPELTETIKAIQQRPSTVTYKQIAEATNVTENWITRLVTGKIDDPSFNKVMRVRDYLAQFKSEAQVS